MQKDLHFPGLSGAEMAIATQEGQVVNRLLQRCGMWLCFLTILFATGDVWPTVSIGFTFRLSQVLLLAAAALVLPVLWNSGIRSFPGWQWLWTFLLWIIVTLPLSLFVTRTIAYILWVVTDFLIIFVFTQFFRTEADFARLLRFFLISFVALSVFGLMQFVLGLVGIDLLVSQWYIPGRIARVNGISYEPSYYATYLLFGWVLSLTLLQQRAPFPSHRLQKACAVSSTAALLFSTSKLAWGVMLAYSLLWLGRASLRWVLRARLRISTAIFVFAAPLLLAGTVVLVTPLATRVMDAASQLSFLVDGVGLFGGSNYSAGTRADDFGATWNALLEHPLSGTGIGALPADIARQRGHAMDSLADAKDNEGMSVFAEVAASTGLIGAAMFLAFGISVALAARQQARHMDSWRRIAITALTSALIWFLITLQFSQNCLRVSIYTDLAVLICGLTARRTDLPAEPSPS